jgi:dimeric dUTPase (all-alpha-NTP-PPase superfamily)
MKVNRINVEISMLANKHRTYLYNEMFDSAKEHQIQGEFGNDFISLKSMPEGLLKVLEDLKIKFRKMGE